MQATVTWIAGNIIDPLSSRDSLHFGGQTLTPPSTNDFSVLVGNTRVYSNEGVVSKPEKSLAENWILLIESRELYEHHVTFKIAISPKLRRSALVQSETKNLDHYQSSI